MLINQRITVVVVALAPASALGAVEVAVVVEAVVVVAAAGSLGFGSEMEVEESGTGPVERVRRYSVFLAQHSGVSAGWRPGPYHQHSQLVVAVAAAVVAVAPAAVAPAAVVAPAPALVVAAAVAFAASSEVVEAYRPGSSESLAYHHPSCSLAQSFGERPTRERLGHMGYPGIAVGILPLCATC